MNRLGRCVLALYCYDPEPEAPDLANELRRALQLVARCPMIVAHSYAAKRHYFDNDSLYLHRSQEGLSFAENFLHAMRHDKRFTPSEARLLDLCMVLHAEHGGGNNSAFACRVLLLLGDRHLRRDLRRGGLPEGPPPRRRQQEGHGDVPLSPGRGL